MYKFNAAKSKFLYDAKPTSIRVNIDVRSSGIQDNKEFDDCTVSGSSLDETMACNDFRTSLVVVCNKMYCSLSIRYR